MKTLQKITSRDNQNVKFVKRVRDGKDDAAIFIEGRRLADEAVSAGIEPTHVFTATSFLQKENGREFVELLARHDSDVFELTDDIFASISDTENPQGIAIIAKRPAFDRESFSLGVAARDSKLPLVIYLFQINNPANLGAVARAAEAAGSYGLITSPGSADVYSAKALRGSMGSLFRLPVWVGVNVDEALMWCRESGFIAAGTGLDASTSYLDIDWRKPRLLMFGSEGHGIPGDVTTQLDEVIHIPMEQEVESLNLAVSAGIILFEARRQLSSGQRSVRELR